MTDSTVPTPWKLPPELDDIILDHLHNDHITLSRCALVRRSWVNTFRYHFWGDLRLACSAQELQRFDAVLDASPDMAHNVRSVELVKKKDEVSQWQATSLLYSALATVTRLPAVTSLVLDRLWFLGPRYGSLPTRATAIESIRFRNCIFQDLGDLQHIAYLCPGLSILQLDGVWWSSCLYEPTIPRLSTLQLKEIALGRCFSRHRIIDWLLDVLSAASLETVRIPYVNEYDNRIRDLLAFAGKSLRHLELGSPCSLYRDADEMSSEPELFEGHIDLTQCDNLRSVTFGVPVYRDSLLVTNWITTLLAQLHSAQISEICLAVYPIFSRDTERAVGLVEALRWGSLASAMQQPQFAGLSTVVFASGNAAESAEGSDSIPVNNLLKQVALPFFQPLRSQGVEIVFR